MKVKTPSWSGKAEEAAMYLTKFKAMCECSGFGNAIVPGVTLMSGAQYNSATDKTTDDCKLFAANQKACAIYILGQETGFDFKLRSSSKISRRRTVVLNIDETDS